MQEVVDKLLSSSEPSIRYKVLVNVLDYDRESRAVTNLQSQIKDSPRVRQLLLNRDGKGRIVPANRPYKKWIGAHWVLATLADLGYPPEEREMIPILDQVINSWLHPNALRESHWKEAPPKRLSKGNGVPIINGRPRRCASQQANALFSALTSGLIDDRCHQLAECLMRRQWPDGGWNCDRKPEANNASFWESLIPLRAMALYAKTTENIGALEAAKCAGEVFLKRHLYRRISDGEVMNPQFLRLHYPCYYYYDILFALKVMAEADFISDSRCQDALDILESKRLPAGGWPAEERFYRNSKSSTSGSDLVSWGGVNKRRINEGITADALYVLKASGRL